MKIMVSFLLFIICMVIMSIGFGVSRYEVIDFILEFKSFSNPYYNVGISFTEHTTEDPEYIEQELIVGLFFVNVILVFYKEKN